MNECCENCQHCFINASDDTEILCEKDHYAVSCGYCEDYEKRDDGLELILVWDWR